jgi:proline iminopeptidase
MPTLLTCGAHDFTTPAATAEFAQRIAGAELMVFDNSAHMPHLEEPEKYVSALRAFVGHAPRA